MRQKWYKVPTFLFVNKMDQRGTDISSIITELKDRLSANIVNCMEPETEECKEEIALCDEALLERYLTPRLSPQTHRRAPVRDRFSKVLSPHK